jgi:poly(A) polymerase Pap1
MKSVQYGVTPPVSEALPTQRELELNEALTDVLAREGMIESEKKAQLRYSQRVHIPSKSISLDQR